MQHIHYLTHNLRITTEHTTYCTDLRDILSSVSFPASEPQRAKDAATAAKALRGRKGSEEAQHSSVTPQRALQPAGLHHLLRCAAGFCVGEQKIAAAVLPENEQKPGRSGRMQQL